MLVPCTLPLSLPIAHVHTDPAAYITGIVIQLVALPCGKALERILPRTVFNFFGYRWSFNPGPFSIKEHVCITIMANVVFAGVFALEVTLSQRVFYGMEVSKGYQMLLALGSQCFGFCLGGFLRQFVVWPSSMIWPGALVNSALFNTLHKNYGQRDRGHMTRERFFLVVFAGSFLWYFVPGYLFTGLSMFSWVCWIVPENVTVNALFGVNSGLGMSMLTFDWGMIAFTGSPLVTPWWSELNTAVAFILIYWIIAPILYCKSNILASTEYAFSDNSSSHKYVGLGSLPPLLLSVLGQHRQYVRCKGRSNRRCLRPGQVRRLFSGLHVGHACFGLRCRFCRIPVGHRPHLLVVPKGYRPSLP